MRDQPIISGSHRTQLINELIHASVVLAVVLCTTILAAAGPNIIPQDVVGTVYGGAIGYAAGRAGGSMVRDSSNRHGDVPPPSVVAPRVPPAGDAPASPGRGFRS